MIGPFLREQLKYWIGESHDDIQVTVMLMILILMAIFLIFPLSRSRASGRKKKTEPREVLIKLDLPLKAAMIFKLKVWKANAGWIGQLTNVNHDPYVILKPNGDVTGHSYAECWYPLSGWEDDSCYKGKDINADKEKNN